MDYNNISISIHIYITMVIHQLLSPRYPISSWRQKSHIPMINHKKHASYDGWFIPHYPWLSQPQKPHIIYSI